MRAVILADRSMAVREREMLARLELGLVGEGVRVVHAIPAECIDAEPIGLYSTPIAYENGWWWTRESRVQRLAERLRKAFDADNVRCVDAVHVFAAQGEKGEPGETWDIARRLALLTRAALLIEVVSAAQVRAAAAFAAANAALNPAILPAGGQNTDDSRVLRSLGFACPDAATDAALAARSPRARSFRIPWGVHAEDDALDKAVVSPGEPAFRGTGVSPVQGPSETAAASATPSTSSPTTPPAPLSVGVLAASKGRWLTSALEALAMLAVRRAPSADTSGYETHGGLMIFIGAEGDQPSGGVAAHAWKLGRKLGILNHLTLIPAMEAKRDPVMDLDALILTDCVGMHRSLTLDAMGSGVAVVSPPDPLVDDLEHGVTCRIVPKPTHAAWFNTLESVLYDAPARRTLLTGAWEYVRRERSASAHVVAVTRAYATLVGEEAGVS